MRPSFLVPLSLVLFISLILLHLLAAPYTKVEESFTIQAIHDVLVYGVPGSVWPWKHGSGGEREEILQRHYDHVQFPGAVPRTFVGALGVAGVVKMAGKGADLGGYEGQVWGESSFWMRS
jgi:hypothetical protein